MSLSNEIQSLIDLLESRTDNLDEKEEKKIPTKFPEDADADTKENKPKRLIDVIGARMKTYEEAALNSKYANPKQTMIVRLDGHCFHTFTKGFDRPFDERLHSAMVNTTQDLCETYNCVTGYTQSDEITLIFASNYENNELFQHIHNGKHLKISTLLASFASVRFVSYLKNTFENEKKELTSLSSSESKINEKIEFLTRKLSIIERQHFDGRTFNVPDDDELLWNIVWRCGLDCRRNSISSLGRAYFSAKELKYLNSIQIMEKLRNEKNVDWNESPEAFRYGTFVKKEIYEKAFVNPQTNESGMCKRTRTAVKPLPIDRFDRKWIPLLLSKYWTKLPV